MKKLPATQKHETPLFTTSILKILSFVIVLLTCGYRQMRAQCPADITVTAATSAGNTGTWVAPSSGGPWVVRITATGGGGGGNGGDTGGGGATISGVFTVQNGQSLFVIAGGPGETPADNNFGGGGGGASGVVNCGNPSNCATGTILLIAAGGNGAEGGNNGNGGSALTTGLGGGGAGGGNNGGGGGGGLNGTGLNGAGTTFGFGGSQVNKTSIVLGGPGNGSGTNDNDGGNGMGAGGGGGSDNGNGSGGGGGHTGGAGGNPATGATSFNSGALTTGTNGTNGGGSNAGSVTISCIGAQNTQCNDNALISLTGPGTAEWTAPSTGGPFIVHITTTGGGGGNAEAGDTGGGGATMSGTFTVQHGQKLLAIAGGAGSNGDATHEAGGGGGSGVVNCGNPIDCSNGTILIIAAGGNGAEDNDGLGGLATTSGGGGGGAGGGSNGGGGGGGLNANGGNGTGTGGSGGIQVSKSAISAGGNGSNGANNKGGDGMGGGGGGGTGNTTGSGGGGGHTGGNGGNPGNPNQLPRSFNSGNNAINTNGVNAAGPSSGTVTVMCLASLPVELINFKALIQKDKTVDLLWSTATEKDNRGFDIERSADNRHWTVLGFVPGAGTSSEQHDYIFTDEKPLTGINYYRLKQVDFDGNFEYSPMVVADVRTNGLQFDVYPNPSVNGEFNVRTVSQVEGNALLEIYDWAGYKVYTETIQMLKGTMVYPVSLSTYPKGAYTAHLKMPDGTIQFKKILLQ